MVGRLGVTAGLVTVLEGRGSSGRTSRTLRHQLTWRWCWPVDPDLARRATEVGGHGPRLAAGAVGEALLVAVDERGGASSLFCLADASRAGAALELRGAALECARLAHGIVSRDLPVLADLNGLSRITEWRAIAVAIPQGLAPITVLDGPSYGLSLALATASRWLGLGLPSLVASAELRADGSLAAVDGLRAKVARVVLDAPGVRRMLVHASQAQAAIEARDETLEALQIPPSRSWLEIVGVDSFRAAFGEAFGDTRQVTSALAAHWRTDPKLARNLSESLYRAALFGEPRVLGWRAIAACAAALKQDVAPALHGQLEVTIAIASRHAGAPPAPLTWPSPSELSAMHRSWRLRYLAHVVQSATDAGLGDAELFVKASAFVREASERSAEDCVLLGAIGRGWAAIEQESEAISALDEAVRSWRDLNLPHEASHALSELLRLLGIRAGEGDTTSNEALRAALHDNVEVLEANPQTSATSLGYLRLAAGRALVQAGAPEDSLRYLASPQWSPMPRHVEASRLRWLARACSASGRHESAARAREELAAAAAAALDPAFREQSDLAQLDDALARAQPTADLLSRLTGELRSALESCPPQRDPTRHVTERFRY